MAYENIDLIIDNLFESAKQKCSIEYIYALLRLEGINYNLQDEFIELNEKLKMLEIKLENRSKNYFLLISYTETLRLLINLLRCSASKPFDSAPYLSETEGPFGEKLNLSQMIELTLDAANEI